MLQQILTELRQGGLWLALGFTGQLIFATRFVVQWIASERKGRSVVPIHFWYLSIAGSVLLLTFALHERSVRGGELVWIFGQSFNIFVYVRNLMLLSRTRKVASEADR